MAPGVFAEIGANGDNRTLVISADGKRDLFPVVQQLHAARPTVDEFAALDKAPATARPIAELPAIVDGVK